MKLGLNGLPRIGSSPEVAILTIRRLLALADPAIRTPPFLAPSLWHSYLRLVGNLTWHAVRLIFRRKLARGRKDRQLTSLPPYPTLYLHPMAKGKEGKPYLQQQVQLLASNEESHLSPRSLDPPTPWMSRLDVPSTLFENPRKEWNTLYL